LVVYKGINSSCREYIITVAFYVRKWGDFVSQDNDLTRRFQVQTEEVNKARDVLLNVYQALVEKGYNPINQIVGYLLSGDPAYITSHKDARNLIRKLERDELLEELIRYYIKQE